MFSDFVTSTFQSDAVALIKIYLFIFPQQEDGILYVDSYTPLRTEVGGVVYLNVFLAVTNCTHRCLCSEDQTGDGPADAGPGCRDL